MDVEKRGCDSIGLGGIGLVLPPPNRGEEATDLNPGVECAETKDSGVGGIVGFLLFELVVEPVELELEFVVPPPGNRKKLLAPPPPLLVSTSS